MNHIESGEVKRNPVRADTPLVAYVRAIGLIAGDILAIEIRNPDGSLLTRYQSRALERNKAQFYVSTGRRPDARNWTGVYVASFSIERSGNKVFAKSFEVKF